MQDNTRQDQHFMTILAAARAQPEPKRRDYLEEACAGDESLLREVREALSWELRMDGFLETPVIDLHDAGDLSGPADGTRIGPYEILRKLGEGGMGVVYHARQSHPIRRDVAMKIVKPGMDSRQVLARFESERQALAMMDHAHIARVFDAGTTPAGHPYFVMGLVNGAPITRYCDEHRLTTRQRLELLIQVCQAIHHAHQKGIIHRDIKPSNILVEEQDGQPVARVIDFGIAKATGQQLTEATIETQIGVVIGTVHYMSPEQADFGAQDIDTRSDIYSLGVVLYELLTGFTPLEVNASGKTGYGEILRKIREDDPQTPSTRLRKAGDTLTDLATLRRTEPVKLARSITGELDWIVMKALEKDRNRRYETAAAFARDIQRYLDGDRVEAAAPSAAYTLRKFAFKYRVPLGIAGAFTVLLIAAVIVSTVEAVRARQAQQESEAVNSFLQNDLLAQATSDSQVAWSARPDPEIKVRTVLDRAARRVSTQFAAQPQIEASIQSTIGESYYGLGLYAQARDHFSRAVELRRKLQGDNHPETLKALSSFGTTLQSLGDYKASRAIHQQALDGRMRVLGPEHPDTLREMVKLAFVMSRQGDHKQAEELGLRAFEAQRRILGEEHPETLATMGHLINIYGNASHREKAEATGVRLLDIERRVYGPEHPRTIHTANSLAWNYFWMGRPEKAVELFAPVVEASRRVKGPEHAETLIEMNNLAVAYRVLGDLDRAEKELLQVLEIFRRTHGDDYVETANTKDSLALVYSLQGRDAEAEAMHRQVLDVYRRHFGDDNEKTLLTMSTLADVYLTEKKYANAEALLRRTLPVRDRKMPNSFLRYLDQSLLGRSLAMQGRYGDAEPLLLSGYPGMLQRQSQIPGISPRSERKNMERAGRWIVELYQSWGKPEKAAEWQAKLQGHA